MKRPAARDLLRFVGRPVVATTALVWMFGWLLFLCELAFAFVLQRLVYALGVVRGAAPLTGPSAITAGELLLLIVVISIARMALGYGQSVLDGVSVERFAHRLRSTVIARSLSGRTVDSGDVLTLFNQRIYTASMAVHAVQTLAWQGTLAAGLLIALAFMSPKLTLVAAAASALVALVPIRWMHRRLKDAAALHADAFERLMRHLHNVFRNFLLIRLYNLQSRERRRIGRQLDEYTSYVVRYHRDHGVAAAVGPVAVAATIVAIAMIQQSAWAIGGAIVVPFVYLLFRLAQTLVPVVGNMSRLSFAWPELQYVYTWSQRRDNAPASAPPEDQRPDRAERRLTRAVGWRLRDVGFEYAGQAPLFDTFDLSIAPGSFVRVRGESGVGKSTLLALMLGEMAPDRGTVDVDLDGRLATAGSAAARLRDHLGYSASESFLFAGTILENVTYGLASPPDERLLARMTAYAECGFVFDLPLGFQHRIDELGQGLSTGQKQRLSLLRALLRQPRVLVLDEALSNVDVPTEARILARLTAMKDGCTIIHVSHRDHASIPADLVVELRGGAPSRRCAVDAVSRPVA